MKEKKEEKNKRWTPFDLKVSINNKTKKTETLQNITATLMKKFKT